MIGQMATLKSTNALPANHPDDMRTYVYVVTVADGYLGCYNNLELATIHAEEFHARESSEKKGGLPSRLEIHKVPLNELKAKSELYWDPVWRS